MHLYFLTVVLIFWVPGVALTIGQWGSRTRQQRRAFWITCAVVAVLSFGMEYVYLWADIWSFSEADDPLLGIMIFGAPLEEFTYWFGASPFLLSVYWLMQRLAASAVPPKAGFGRRQTKPRRIERNAARA